MSAYSKTPLQKKLGIVEGEEIIVLNSPKHYSSFFENNIDFSILEKLNKKSRFVHYFQTNLKTFLKDFPMLRDSLDKAGFLWISWPKKSSEINSDIVENKIRDFVLQNGMVDVKVCAVDEDWSGLKLVFRIKDRK